MMKFLARGGVLGENPENTMPAFRAAADQGYAFIEVPVRVTKDLQCVVLQDSTINRTARKADGSIVGAALPAAWVCYEQLLAYDFGIGYHVKFKGTKLPLLEDVLQFARENSLKVKIASGCHKLRQSHREALFALLDGFVDVAELTVNTTETLAEAAKRYRAMCLHWDGPMDADTLTEVGSIVPKETLTLWVRDATTETIAAAKQYGSAGVYDLPNAEDLGADIVSTHGALKPEQNKGILSDMHVHTDHSHDAHYPMEQMVQGGLERGVQVMAIADHCDVTRCENDPDWDIYTNIQEACAEVDALNEKYGDRCLLLRSVELGDGVWYPEQSYRVATQLPYDVVIGSIHAIRCEAAEAIPLKEKWYSQIKFLDVTEDQYQEFMNIYWDDVLTMVETENIDIMAHLFCGCCYYGYRYKIWKDMRPFEEQITKILRRVIEKGIAMEASRMLFLQVGDERPYMWLLEKYRQLGGYLVTISTDAHSPGEVGADLAEHAQLLKQMGFTHIFYYKDRKAVPCSL